MSLFHFKQFTVDDHGCGMKICSDSVLLGAWFFSKHIGATSVVDIGAGSGVLSLIGAQFCPEADLTGVEIDESASAACRLNFGASPWTERLSVVNSSFSEFVPEEKCSLIISNPPYFSNGATAPDPSRAVARHQSELSYASLASYAGRHLAADGFLGLVAPSELEDSILFDASLAGLHLSRLCRVRTSPSKAPTRILMEFSRKPSTPHVADLSLHSDEYKALVGDLYTKI